MAAVFAAGAVTVLFQLSLLVTKQTTTSFAVACSLPFSYYFWASAVVAEVYTLHVFLTGLTIHLLVKWDKSQGNRLLFAALFAWGLSFGNHMSTMLMGPAVAFLILRGLQQNRIFAATVLLAVPAFVLPLTLYLPWRYSADALPYGNKPLRQFRPIGPSRPHDDRWHVGDLNRTAIRVIDIRLQVGK